MKLPDGMKIIEELRSDEGVRTLRAQPPGDSEPVVIKAVELPSENREAIHAAVRSRLGAWRSIDHPAILRPLQVSLGSRRLVLVLPDVRTGSLADRFRIGATSTLDLRDLCEQARRGLQLLHEAGFAHGNVKPSNLLIDEEGSWRLSDPQLAVPDRPSSAEGAGFRAPELSQGSGPTPAADQYSLAMVLLSLLTGSRPEGAVRALEAEGANGQRRPTARSMSGSSLPLSTAGVLRRALAADPEDRWPSVAEFIYRFQISLGYEVDAPASLQTQPEPKPPPSRETRRVRGRLLAPLLALFLCAAAAIPAYGLGWFDDGLALLGGGSGSESSERSIRGVAAELNGDTPTPTALAGSSDPAAADDESTPLNDSEEESVDESESSSSEGSEPAATPTPTPTPEESTEDESEDPTPTLTPTPEPTDTPAPSDDADPNSCHDDPDHPRYCTPTP